MTRRFAFEPDDLAPLLTLELADPGDVADIDAVYEILLRRSAAGSAVVPTGPDQDQDQEQEQDWGPGLHLVPDLP